MHYSVQRHPVFPDGVESARLALERRSLRVLLPMAFHDFFLVGHKVAEGALFQLPEAPV